MDLMNLFKSILASNHREVDGHRYTVPSSDTYPYQWLWDSCFHAIIYARLNEFEKACDEIRSLLSGQWASGMIPHMIYWETRDEHLVDWGVDTNTSSMTQPPMIAYAVERIYNLSDDESFVKEVFDGLDAYYKWLNNDRAEDYIVSIIHPWESGEDDFVPWDNVLGLDHPSKEELKKHKLELLKTYIETGIDQRKTLGKNQFNVRSLLFNCVYLRNLKSMQSLARLLDKDTGYYGRMINDVTTSCKKHLYDRKTKLFSSYYNDHEFITDYENSSMFLPLFAGLNTRSQAKRLVDDYLLDEEKFWTKYPIPTIACDNDNFEPDRYWRGSVWININWFIYNGLIDYGFDDIAYTLREKTISLVKKSGFHEYYNPLNGSGRGPNDFCWSGLIFDM